MLGRVQQLSNLIREATSLPVVTIDLMLAQAKDNDPFFSEVTRSFYREATRRHPKFPLIRRVQYGLAVCELQRDKDWYVRGIDASGRRNVKKAQRLGYRFERIDYNQHLAEVTAIHRSTPVRQGRDMPADILTEAKPNGNPLSKATTHDYPYFGVFGKEGQLVAYASCLIAGELCSIETIFGHHDHLADGVVPMLYVSIADYILQHHPKVRYYAYGTYYGASDTLKRFKRKFMFHPHRVTWRLGK